jgi:hypothetical protein
MLCQSVGQLDKVVTMVNPVDTVKQDLISYRLESQG